MLNDVVIPAQLRAARALVGISQEQLATSAGVGLSTVRDAEGERRSGDTAGISAIRRVLQNSGVKFLPGVAEDGPGVRLVAGRPNVTRQNRAF